MRILTEKSAWLCDCTEKMQEKITKEALRWYDLEMDDNKLVYQYIDFFNKKERFTSFIWILRRFNGLTDMIGAIVSYMAYIQYTRYGDEKTASLMMDEYKLFYSKLSETKQKDLDVVIEEEKTAKSGWRS